MIPHAIRPLFLAAWLAAYLAVGLPARADFALEFPRGSRVAPQSLPSVVRITVQDADAVSRGSGTLVGTDEKHGFVLTNWHVVRDATGQILVEFPDGFRSAATVLKTDAQWDLALLVIWRPTVDPLPLAATVPQPGDWLTIAGYGPGEFRAARGVCTDYVAPSPHAPFEMIEIATRARYGDSGGPMINQRGELAAVLFGSGDGRTTGSHVARVRQFLNSAFTAPPDGQPAAPDRVASSTAPASWPVPFVPPADAILVETPQAKSQIPQARERTNLGSASASATGLAGQHGVVADVHEDDAGLPPERGRSRRAAELTAALSDLPAASASTPDAAGPDAAGMDAAGMDAAGMVPQSPLLAQSAPSNSLPPGPAISLWDQLKSILAIIGLISLVMLLLPK